MLLAKENVDSCAETYYNQDMISIFPGYMALMSKQPWEFPAHFGTYDPSNRALRNQLLFPEQVVEKRNDGYFSMKRVAYKRFCPVKKFIREHFMR